MSVAYSCARWPLRQRCDLLIPSLTDVTSRMKHAQYTWVFSPIHSTNERISYCEATLDASRYTRFCKLIASHLRVPLCLLDTDPPLGKPHYPHHNCHPKASLAHWWSPRQLMLISHRGDLFIS